MNKMFSFPQKYVVGNIFIRQHALDYIQQFKNDLKWNSKPNTTLMDVGCGPGDVLIDYVEPLFNNNYKQIVGIDISEESINYARQTYGNNYPRVKFELMDIADKKLKVKEQFDHVTSLYCLNFVQDQSQAVQNIYNLVKEGGDVFLLLMAQCHIFLILDLLAANPRFKPHMKDVNSYASSYRFSETPAEDFTEVLKAVGFKDINCKARRSYFIYEKYQVENHLAMVDFLEPETSDIIRKQINKGFEDTMKELDFVNEESGKILFKFWYTNFLAYAKKP